MAKDGERMCAIKRRTESEGVGNHRAGSGKDATATGAS